MSLIDRCVSVPGRRSVISEQRGAIRSVRDKENAIVRNRSARTAKPLDRPVHGTRKLLQDPLVSLMIEKGDEATTVQDIIDRANVGRATFYAHFADKETLLVSRTRGPAGHAGAPATTRARSWLQPPDAGACPRSCAALRRDRGPGERRLRAATHSPDHRGSRGAGPQDPRLQGHARAARSRDGVHRRRLHGRSDLVAEPRGQAAAAGGRGHLSRAGDARAGNGVGVAAERQLSDAPWALTMG